MQYIASLYITDGYARYMHAYIIIYMNKYFPANSYIAIAIHRHVAPILKMGGGGGKYACMCNNTRTYICMVK